MKTITKKRMANTYPENQITVIDAYYKGSCGWSYSHTLLSNKQCHLSTDDTYEDLYLTRVLEEDPKPLQYLNDNSSIIDANICEDKYKKYYRGS